MRDDLPAVVAETSSGGLSPVLWSPGQLTAPAKGTLLAGLLATSAVAIFNLAIFQLPAWVVFSTGLGTALVGSLFCPLLSYLENWSLRLRTSLPLVLGFSLQGGILGLGIGIFVIPVFSQLTRFLYLATWDLPYHLRVGQVSGEILSAMVVGTLLGSLFGLGVSLARKTLQGRGSLALGAGIGLGGLYLLSGRLGLALAVMSFSGNLSNQALSRLLSSGYLSGLVGTGFPILGALLLILQICAGLPFLTAVALPVSEPGQLPDS